MPSLIKSISLNNFKDIFKEIRFKLRTITL